MSQQKTRHEAGEVGLIGLGVFLLQQGATQITADTFGGAALLLAGLVSLGVGVRVRNITVGLAPDEVARYIEEQADRLEDSLSDQTAENGTEVDQSGDGRR